jgi:hypothetical protein
MEILGYRWDSDEPRYQRPPGDWSEIQWHADPDSRTYKTSATAARACNWLNRNEHGRDEWLYRPAPGAARRVTLQRRWVG